MEMDINQIIQRIRNKQIDLPIKILIVCRIDECFDLVQYPQKPQIHKRCETDIKPSCETD